jgi:serine/threonine-protein kinase
MPDSSAKDYVQSRPSRKAFEPLRLGRYYLVDQLSKGGMSDIYLAKSVGASGFQKPLVIKKLLPEYAGEPRYVRRFINEAKTLSRLNHANIVQILDIGQNDDDYYMALEYIEGRNLAHLLSKAQKAGEMPSLSFCLHVMIELTKGLAYSHRKKGTNGESLMLVHQDVNSFNVMISYEAEVKIIDFGIAHILLDANESTEFPIAGKLLYFAPEQLQGKEVDRKVDIYGSGVLFYELLTGERLFNHQETVQQTIKTILEADLTKIIDSDSRIHDDLKPVLKKSMAPDREERYGCAEEMTEDLMAVIRKCDVLLDPIAHAKYLQGIFQKELLIDRRRMRSLLALERTPGDPPPDERLPPPVNISEKERSVLVALLGGKPVPDEAMQGLEDLPTRVSRTIQVRAGRTIYQQGEPGNYVYVVKTGKVKVYISSGPEDQTLMILGPGDVFGESALLVGSERCLSAQAEDDCVLYSFEREHFISLVGAQLGAAVFMRMAQKLRDCVSLLESALLEDPLSRLLFALISFHRRRALEGITEIDLDDLKDLFKLEQSDRVDKYIEKLEALEVVETRDTKIWVKDLEKLENIHRVLTGEGKFILTL